MSSQLGLHYAPHLDSRILHNLEMAGRSIGLPLEQLELLGQCQSIAVEFTNAVISDCGQTYLACVDWNHLDGLYQSHRITMPQALMVS
jgi:hypothetical protein